MDPYFVWRMIDAGFSIEAINWSCKALCLMLRLKEYAQYDQYMERLTVHVEHFERMKDNQRLWAGPRLVQVVQ